MSGLFGFAAVLIVLVPYREEMEACSQAGDIPSAGHGSPVERIRAGSPEVIILLVILSRDRDWKALIIYRPARGRHLRRSPSLFWCAQPVGLLRGYGVFPGEHYICYGNLSPVEQVKQQAYNVGASLVGIFFPGLFSRYGAICRLQRYCSSIYPYFCWR
ncbi:MAG: hypothetical protein U0703_20100 [Anaerolineae bacterium]